MPALPPLATVEELAARTGRPKADQKLVGALVDASRRFRAAVHHDVSLVEGEELELDGTGGRTLLLPAAPVVAITSFVLTNGGTELVAGVDYTVSKRVGILRRAAGRVWPDELGFATLIWSHGYDAIEKEPPYEGAPPQLKHVPDTIQGAVLDMAQVLINVEAGIQGKTVLGDNVQYGSVAATGVTQTWSDAVANYRIGHGDRA